SPFLWGAVLTLGPLVAVVALNSVATLVLTSDPRRSRVLGFLAPLLVAVLAPAVVILVWASWRPASRAYASFRYRRSPLAAAAQAGRWEILRNDVRTGEVRRWRDGALDAGPP